MEDDFVRDSWKSQRPGASVFAISVIIGALTSSVTSTLPGGLSSTAWFLIGLVASFFIGSSLVIYAGRVQSLEAETRRVAEEATEARMRQIIKAVQNVDDLDERIESALRGYRERGPGEQPSEQGG